MPDEVKKILFKLEMDATQYNQSVAASTAATDKNTESVKKTTAAIEAEEKSIAQLRQRNKELTQERNATSTATDAGRKKIQELNAELDKNNTTIKANVDAYTKQKLGVGDYGSALDKLVPGLGSTTTGILNMTKAAWAFVANPIGAIIAAIGLALGALTAYFRGSEEGQNKLNRIMLVGSTIMEKIMDVVEDLGEAIFAAFENPKQAVIDLFEFIKNNLINRVTALVVIFEGLKNLDFKQVTNGIIQLGTGIENAIDKVQNLAAEIVKTVDEAVVQANRLADLQEAIDEKNRKLIVDRSKVNLEVAKLRRDAVTQEGEEKEKTIRAAIALEEKLATETVKYKKLILEQAQLELKANGDTKDAKLKVAEAEAAVIDAEASRFEATLRFAKELEKLHDAEVKKKEEEAQRIREEQQEQQRIELEQAENNRKYVAEKREKDAKTAADKEKKIEEIKSEGISKLIDKVTQGRINGQKLYTTIFKKGALAEAYANTKAAAIAAYKSLAGIPIVGPALGLLAGAAVTAYGLAQAAGINAIPFARGGRTNRLRTVSGTRISDIHGIPIQRENGDDLLATVKRKEVILNETQQAALGGDAAFRRAGVPGFNTGGRAIEAQQTQIASAAFSDQNQLVQIANAILNQPPKILVMEEFEAKQFEKDSIKNKARII